MQQLGTWWKWGRGWLLMLAAVSAQAAASNDKAPQVWQGTLGKSQIVLELEHDDGQVSGSYFYLRHRMDISLNADDGGDARHWLLQEFDGNNANGGSGDPAPQWSLQPQPDGSLVGTWTGAKGRSLPIQLRAVHVDALVATGDAGLDALRAIDPYAFLRLQTQKLKADKRETVNGYTLQWWSDDASGVSLFQIVDGYPAAQRDRLNLALRTTQWQEIEGYYQCLGQAGSENGDYEVTTTLRHIDAKVVSVSLLNSYYCGGAHPDFADTPINLDARTGKDLSLEDVLWLGQGTPPVEADFDQYSNYRDKVFAPWVVKQFVRLYPQEMTGGSDDGDCNYRDPDVWNFASWYVTDKGIHLAAYFARVERPCDDPDFAVLPWSVVNQHPGKVRLHAP